MDIRIVVADNHPAMRTALRDLLTMHEGMAVVGEAGNGREALRLAAALAPDILLIDMETPALSGLEVADRLRRQGAATR